MLLPKKLGLVAITIATLTWAEGAIAETCIPLKVIGGQGTLQRKEVSVPSVPFIPFVPFVSINNNWNTDFSVPGGRVFDYYIATITPEGNVTYGMEMHLKYSNRTNDKFLDHTIDLREGEQYKIVASSRPENAPYEVNVLVGGVDNALGTYYTLLVEACNGELDNIPGINDVRQHQEFKWEQAEQSIAPANASEPAPEFEPEPVDQDVTEIEIRRERDRPAPPSSPTVRDGNVQRDSDVRRAN
ncbi:hypothetical protein Pse7367_0960 [Thalassoporum mexicanum PCC 7367]|uniref:hypothetical protein n=1 Tax=Thalassoporum mexicanum TaxID=3457544 RepID=UPI00029F8D9F|nr:hypothetical protein [Pseudanabaena sp. PCC 7367]AFY69260.1 hypothetical protein Pse7367_0960 [Pseudanabaena sp. PCC 7367]